MVKTAGRGDRWERQEKERERERESRCERKDNFGKRCHKSVTNATVGAGV